jgi:glycosyltransferase involved in cell wall biosynthesis
MPDPKYSVVIPAYNCRDLVLEALDSVRAQTFTDYEVLVVDDGSTDGTYEAICRYAKDWDRLRCFQAPHKGLAAARNLAISHMKGSHVALLDADDLWLPEKLARCDAFLQAHPDLSIVYTPMKPIRVDGTAMQGHSKPCHAGQLTDKLFQSIFVHDPAAVFHRRVIETCGGFDENLPVCVGHEFWLRVSKDFQFGLIDEPLALRRWSQESLTRSNRVRGRRIKAAMLARFYRDPQARRMLRDKPARRRLAKVHYAAGKILIRQSRPRQARAYLRRALAYKPGFVKALPFYLWATIRGLSVRDDPELLEL